MDLLDAIKSEIRITEYAQRQGFTVVRAGMEYTLKEHDSVRINPDKNLFVRNADTNIRGSIIDYVMWTENLGQRETISKLRSMLQYGPDYTPRPRLTHHPTVRQPFELPKPAAGKYNRVFAYLNKTRGIDSSTIGDMMRRGLLYEDERHNCVFLGKDYDGQPAYAAKRTTNTEVSYRGDAAGSRKEVGFFVNNNAPALFVTEAPIDALSIMSMLRHNNRDPTQYSYLALGGTADKALVYHLSRPENTGIRRVYLATDHDTAGDTARAQLRESLEKIGYDGKVIDKVPTKKDWNDDLRSLRSQNRQQGQSPQKPAQNLRADQITFMERGLTP